MAPRKRPTRPPSGTALPRLRDRIGPGLRVLFVGINPGVRSALTGHHFAGFSNRFWKLLFAARLVPEPLTFEDDGRLPGWGYGITNIVARATRGIDELRPQEFVVGRRALMRKVRRCRPEVVALVGVTVYRAMFPDLQGGVRPGLQSELIGHARVFVLPNPSGRNANFSHDEMLAAFVALRRFLTRRSRISTLAAAAVARPIRSAGRPGRPSARDRRRR
jgi:TDG/mug DNA glycosylase family protein